MVSKDVIFFAKKYIADDFAILDAIPMIQIDEIRVWDSKGTSLSDKKTRGIEHKRDGGVDGSENAKSPGIHSGKFVNGANQPKNRRPLARKG